jgi:hypothetical protein
VRKQPLLVAAASLLVSCGVASAQYQTSPDQLNAPTALQSTTPDRPPLATVPEATDAAAVPRRQTTGQSPNVSKKIGAEMDSAGDKQASPDEQ